MKIKLTLPEQAADYIRHARTETLKAINESPTPENTEPAPFGMYLLAYDSAEQRPVGMLEFTFFRQVYNSFEESPYPSHIGLDRVGPFDSFIGTRTIYVEPEARGQASPYYLMLTMAGAKISHDFGARYTTATTNVSNSNLMRLYSKTGTLVGTYRDQTAKSEIAVWVFDLERHTKHRGMKRLEKHLEVDPRVAATIRSRSRWDHEPKCA